MSVLDTIKNRRSIRDFKKQEIPGKSIEALVEALRWAPSAGNLQSRKFYFVFNADMKKKLADSAGKRDIKSRVKKLMKSILGLNSVSNAPLVVVACLDGRIAECYGDRGVQLYGIQDASASVMNMMLVAHDVGLGSVWIGAFREEEVAKHLGLPE